MTLTKPSWFHTGSFKDHMREIMANLKQVVEIPMGYQDENGFHFGADPALKEIQWPPA